MIESDIAFDRFDPTLAKYKPQLALSTVTPSITPVTSKVSLAVLWEQFLEYKKPQCGYLVNYEERERQNPTYTSQVAESHIESIINARYKRSGKMQLPSRGSQ